MLELDTNDPTVRFLHLSFDPATCFIFAIFFLGGIEDCPHLNEGQVIRLSIEF